MFSIDFKREFLRCLFKSKRQKVVYMNSKGQCIMRRTSVKSYVSTGSQPNGSMRSIDAYKDASSSSSNSGTIRLLLKDSPISKRFAAVEDESSIRIGETSSNRLCPKMTSDSPCTNSPCSPHGSPTHEFSVRKCSLYSDTSASSTSKLVLNQVEIGRAHV